MQEPWRTRSLGVLELHSRSSFFISCANVQQCQSWEHGTFFTDRITASSNICSQNRPDVIQIVLFGWCARGIEMCDCKQLNISMNLSRQFLLEVIYLNKKKIIACFCNIYPF